MDLPNFDGDTLKWEAFRDQFKSLVIDVTGLTNVQRLMYLQNCLTGEAAALIQNTPLTDISFAGAWEDLEARYGNTRIISSFHMKSMFSIPSVAKSKPSELRRLIDSFRQSIRAFRALKKPVTQWDEFFVYLLVQKLDTQTRLAWETSLTNSKEVPTFQQLSDFLENRVHALTFAFSNSNNNTPPKDTQRSRSNAPHASNSPNKTALTVSKDTKPPGKKGKTKPNSQLQCPICKSKHYLRQCAEFKTLSPDMKLSKVQELQLCLNCLNKKHEGSDCKTNSKCALCDKAHHVLLHNSLDRSDFQTSSKSIACCSLDSFKEQIVLLASARVRLVNRRGKTLVVRALLDTCAEASLITEAAAQALDLSPLSVNIPVSGIQGSSTGEARKAVELELQSPRDDSFSLKLNALVLPKLTNKLPHKSVVTRQWSHLHGLPLADPDYATPGDIDLLIGADLTGHLLLDESRRGSVDEPIARLTPFGWVILGPATSVQTGQARKRTDCYAVFTEEHFWEDRQQNSKVICHCTLPVHSASNPSVSKTRSDEDECVNCDLQKFWEIEEMSQPTPLSQDDERCEQLYANSIERNESGRYVVRLPFKEDPKTSLGSNKQAATAVLLSNERRFLKDADLKTEYSKFMAEYSGLGHMTLSSNESGTFLPHHVVWKKTPKPKIRIVFNASHITESANSLNDCLFAGPKLQKDLWTVITRARFFKYFFTADIVKMFRQILVHPQDTVWQKILWRSSPTDPMQTYDLQTVTYGTTCAPYLALRTLIQLSNDEGSRFPLGANVINETSYLNDFLAGADDLQAALEVKNQLVHLLASGGFELGKWASNVTELGSNSHSKVKLLQEYETVSTLGLTWTPLTDKFSLKVDMTKFRSGQSTKRTVLSDIARLFDPLGWFAPVLVTAKVLIQNLWLAGLDWDHPLPQHLLDLWLQFKSTLPQLESIEIPRWLGTLSTMKSQLELHVFCDASERAYATTIYLRIVGEFNCTTHLLMAKSKVAPVKTVSVPRLELCGAVLAAKHATQILVALHLENTQIFAYTDSQVALAWIRSHPSKWSVFVANRVSLIQQLIPPESWRHIRTDDNPADLATRGITPLELQKSDLWWHGPSALLDPNFPMDSNSPIDSTELEEKTTTRSHKKTVMLETTRSPQHEFLNRYSDLNRLIRVTAFMLRFLDNVKCRRGFRQIKLSPILPLKTSELSEAFLRLKSLSQKTYFAEEIQHLKDNKNLYKRSTIKSLHPFLDSQLLLRVGGRLQFQESLSFNEKHPIILHKNCPLAKLIVNDAHFRTLHGGPQLVVSHLVRQYWITHVHSLARQVVNQCVVCTRFSKKTLSQVMGNLPKTRIHSIRPFLASGVDYAGPISLRTTKGRGHKSYKGYICLFICMATRAIHLEAVSDLTSKAFIAAFSRFVSRRGHCQTLTSDNGTTFVGADKELQQMFTEASKFYQEAAAYLRNDNTEWTFIPPLSPHMGGLWEAGVKSVKHHLRRVIGTATLTFEEMATLLCQIEACLNSRPLTSLSKDPQDLAPLTPGHFLVGHGLTTIPEPGFVDLSITPASRFRLITRMRDDFWRRWKSDYLQTLQPPACWRDVKDDLMLNSLVLITDENTPPAKWPLARVIKLHRAPDHKVRSVTVRTATSEFVRPIVKLCLLPIAPTDGQNTTS